MKTILLWLAALAAPGDGPPPQRPVAGLDGFQALSEIVYAERPELPQHLQVVYAFPDRCTWKSYRQGGNPANRVLEYRFGQRAYRMLPARPGSSELPSPERDATFRRMELRRAALFWPDGFSWSESEVDGERHATAELEGLGQLEVRLDEAGRPAWLRVLDPLSKEQERLVVVAWHTVLERHVPERLQLVVGDRTVWTETVLRFAPAFHPDVSFLPPDQRIDNDQVHSLDLIGMTYRTFPVAADLDWEAAAAAAHQRIDALTSELEPLGLRPEPTPIFELDEACRPARCLVRLDRFQAEPPEGWTSVPERPGLMLLSERDALDTELIQRLRQAVPDGTRAGTPYVRLMGDAPAMAQVLLPLVGVR